jgi:hypothetical protein
MPVATLSAPAQAVLAAQQPKDGSFVFCGTRAFASWSRGTRELDARLPAAGTKLDHWTQHDLRRSHVSGHKAGIAGIYNRATYEKEKRAALAMWADHFMATVEGRASNVVPLRA